MDNGLVIQKAAQCLNDAKTLIKALDESPAFIKSTAQAKQARQTAEIAIELVTELLQRVKTDLQGVERGHN